MSDHILEHWEDQAEKHGISPAASWGDVYAINLEIQTIGSYLSEGDNVLDVGCGNGYSTIQYLERKIRSITGIDFSKKMIEQANNIKDEKNLSKATFEVGDIRKMKFEEKTFDVVFTTRVLINLPTWEQQIQGIKECLRVCKKGGTVIFSEAFWEPLVLLNSIRTLKSLPPLVEHDFNRYLKKEKLEDFLGENQLRFNVVDFSSIYYLGSRFLRELVTNPDDYPGYSNPINEIFYNIEQEYSGGGFGIQQAYVISL